MSSSAWTALLGPKLLRDGQEIATESAGLGEKKAIGLYFSAHWCPPCRGFTPKLAEWYKTDLQNAGLEIVFVSSDRDPDSFKSYSGEQPWLALPYDQRDIKTALSKKFKVQGIPSFVILGPDGSTITTKGREKVCSDPKGEDLPWAPKPLKELLGTEFEGKGGAKCSLSDFDGKKLGIYFSAHWCPPCRGFTPKLIEAYKALQEKGEKMEIVFVSSDKDDASFKEYFGEMPWKAVPFADKKRKEALSSYFEVEGIPSFVMLDENRETLNASAVGKVRTGGAASYPWAPDAVKEIDQDPEGVQDAPAVVCLQEKLSKEDQEKNKELLKTVAKKVKAEKMDFIFFTASDDGPLAQKVRNECQVATNLASREGEAQVIMMDLEDQGGYYVFDQDLNADNLWKFFEAYGAKKLLRKQMGAEE